ncbi:hypothetical protein ACFX1R_046023 [Malus domestica]
MAQEDMVMIPTSRWSLEPICFGTISLERGIPSSLMVDTLCEDMNQVQNFGTTQEEGLPELVLPKEAQDWLDEFTEHIRGKRKDLLGPNNFYVNMTRVLSAMFYAEHDQPSTMEGDYWATEHMMAHVSVGEA